MGIVSPENKALRGRIYNWKFTQASHLLNGESQEVQDLVNCLSDVFGDLGWQDGKMAIIIAAAVDKLIGTQEEE